MNRPLTAFKIANPTGESKGMEPVRLDVLRAAVHNSPTDPEPTTTSSAPPVISSVSTSASRPLISKNIRLPADLVEFIDYVYTKEKRIMKQDAYTQALEAYFRPLMTIKDTP